MNIHIDPKFERQIEELAISSGKTVDEVFGEVLRKGLSETPLKDSAANAKAQRHAIKKLQEELRSLPVGNPDDGFDASQHDKVIYRRDW